MLARVTLELITTASGGVHWLLLEGISGQSTIYLDLDSDSIISLFLDVYSEEIIRKPYTRSCSL